MPVDFQHSCYWVLLVSGWFAVSQTIIHEAQEHFITPTARRHTNLFGGFGLMRGLSFGTTSRLPARFDGSATEVANPPNVVKPSQGSGSPGGTRLLLTSVLVPSIPDANSLFVDPRLKTPEIARDFPDDPFQALQFLYVGQGAQYGVLVLSINGVPKVE